MLEFLPSFEWPHHFPFIVFVTYVECDFFVVSMGMTLFRYPRLSLTVPDLSFDCQCKICFSLSKKSWRVHVSGPGDLSAFQMLISNLFLAKTYLSFLMSLLCCLEIILQKKHKNKPSSCASVWPRPTLCPVLPVLFALHATKQNFILICSAFS